MKLQEDLIKLLSKTYEPSAITEIVFKGKDAAFKTDAGGNAVVLFIGRRTAEGVIRGERFARTLVYDKAGNAIKDHWEKKGKAS